MEFFKIVLTLLKIVFFIGLCVRQEFSTNYTFYLSYFNRDMKFCNNCFNHQKKDCRDYFDGIEDNPISYSLQGLRRFINHYKDMRILNLENHQGRVIYKYYGFDHRLQEFESTVSSSSAVEVNYLMSHSDLNGVQLCPDFAAKRLATYFNASESPSNDQSGENLSRWLYLLTNKQPLLLPHLEALGFPVPPTVVTCGFAVYQKDVGKTLDHFYYADFPVKLNIAKQLLEAALQFTYGFDNFRLYITDLTADNIVYDTTQRKVYFVDLDSLFIVDSRAVCIQQGGMCSRGSVHQHEFMECQGCFAYHPDKLCASALSDINLFATCQLLREDLYKNKENGFLYPLPHASEIPEIEKMAGLLDECFECRRPTCDDRFDITERLILTINKILLRYYGEECLLYV